MIPLSWRRLALLTVPLLLAAAAPARAQVTDSLRLGERQRQPMVPDTTRPRVNVPDSLQRRYRISPRDAFFRSLILPGWGQSSIGAPGRGAVYFALESGSLWMVYKSNQKLQEARELEATQHEAGILDPERTLPLVRARRNEREDWITLSVFWFFFSGADAFVSAYLRDFDRHVGVAPAPTGGAQLQVSVPVGN
ncbi:MAG TPA: DUF5683 domain-containing protein [Longimicrobium sp.]